MIYMNDEITLDELIRIILDEMAEDERTDEYEAARIHERIFSEEEKEDHNEQ